MTTPAVPLPTFADGVPMTHDEAMEYGKEAMEWRLRQQAMIDYYMANHPSKPKGQPDEQG